MGTYQVTDQPVGVGVMRVPEPADKSLANGLVTVSGVEKSVLIVATLCPWIARSAQAKPRFRVC